MQCRCLARKEEVENRPPKAKMKAKALLRTFAQQQIVNQPEEVVKLENMLCKVFAGPIYALNVEEISLHFLEEVGEVSEALAEATTSQAAAGDLVNTRKLALERPRKTLGIAEELADVFSWAVSFLAKARQQLQSFDTWFEARADPDDLKVVREVMAGAKHINVADIIWQQYGLKFGELRCADCEKRPCECEEANRRTLRGDHLKQCRQTIQRALARLE